MVIKQSTAKAKHKKPDFIFKYFSTSKVLLTGDLLTVHYLTLTQFGR